ncbi:hypothetical protein [Pseudomonas sp. CFBP 13719]|uniref:hypothetical protein n=1 Tax=Pseudomonas sp. CFBP 13719 TaxID=2775303 RepID=UPI00177AC81C|nr:hypothetical protein [Pseudomonas sp. CFBP 13719]MBD8614877.1 hypothetical protein [Pseudomonas putida]MBD8681439.1 hypothetical protein [Pseudomonas sp. CFBP 13719]
MGAQVVFAVNHALIDKLDDSCLDWLGLQASVHCDSPRTWIASDWDEHDRSMRARSISTCRPILSFSYSDYQATSTLLIAHDMILPMYGLQDLDFKGSSEFSDLAKQISKKARYSQHPFHDRACRHAFIKRPSAPIEPGNGNITLFIYETDSWSWNNRQESRDKLAQIAQYCSTGHNHEAFPYDAQTGEFFNSFRPLCTLGPEQRAIVRLRNAQPTVLILPQRPMVFPELTRDVGCSDLGVIKVLMASQGLDYERRPVQKSNDFGL